PMANPSMMFRKELFDRFGAYNDGIFPEDYELFLRFQARGIVMSKVASVVLTWRDSKNRLTRNDSRYSQEAFYKIKAKYLADWLAKNNPFYPKVYVWGAGRLSRRRSEYLKFYGIEIEKFIDVREGSGVVHYENIPEKKEYFIVSYVANRGARDEIRAFLNSKKYEEGTHYIIAS
ncbi:MAG: glycosyltransferase family 2 protein, partial [Bacteroidota bacterium]